MNTLNEPSMIVLSVPVSPSNSKTYLIRVASFLLLSKGYFMLSELDKKAFLTNFEIACEAGLLALIADFIWLTHDIIGNGLSFTYSVIAIGLLGGIALTAFALYRHHVYYTHRLMIKPRRIYRRKAASREAI